MGTFAQRYVVPVATTPAQAPDVLCDLATDMAYYKLAFLSLPPAQAKALKDDIAERVAGIVDGTITLVGPGGL